MTRVLVAFGSKMGGTAGIAACIAETLQERGLEVSLLPARKVQRLDGYDAVLVGSAIYTSRWRPEAVRLLQRMARSGIRPPTWLFHSGPLEVAEKPEAQPLPDEVKPWAAQLDTQEVRIFGGRLPEHPKGFVAKMMAKTRAGDWRDLQAVTAWASGIADILGEGGS